MILCHHLDANNNSAIWYLDTGQECCWETHAWWNTLHPLTSTRVLLSFLAVLANKCSQVSKDNLPGKGTRSEGKYCVWREWLTVSISRYDSTTMKTVVISTREVCWCNREESAFQTSMATEAINNAFPSITLSDKWGQTYSTSLTTWTQSLRKPKSNYKSYAGFSKPWE